MGGSEEEAGAVNKDEKSWKIIILPIAEQQLLAIKDTRVQSLIAKRIDSLRYEPDKQGKALLGEMEGYRSLRAVGQRYRILYKIVAERVVVVVVTLGMRKEGDKTDVYTLAKKLIRLGLLQLD